MMEKKKNKLDVSTVANPHGNPTFGLGRDIYNVPSTDNLWKKPYLGSSAKEKNVNYTTRHVERKMWVPGSPSYQTLSNWSALKAPNGKIDKATKMTFINTIFAHSKVKEKSSPGVGSYEIDKQWKNHSKFTNTLRVNYKLTNPRETFPSNITAEKAHVPAANKYDTVAFERYKERSINPTISKTVLDRFGPAVKNAKPAPTTYESTRKEEFYNTRKGKMRIGTEKRVSFIERRIKADFSPGIGHYKDKEKGLDYIHKSPSPRKRL